MNTMMRARFTISICMHCLGCNKLEDINFPGERKCKDFKEAKGLEEMGKREEYKQEEMPLLQQRI